MAESTESDRDWDIEVRDPPPEEPVGELTPWLSGDEPDEVSASLSFQADTLDPDAVTHALGVEPTTLKRPGKKLNLDAP